jgi:hypothetical protein
MYNVAMCDGLTSVECFMGLSVLLLQLRQSPQKELRTRWRVKHCQQQQKQCQQQQQHPDRQHWQITVSVLQNFGLNLSLQKNNCYSRIVSFGVNKVRARARAALLVKREGVPTAAAACLKVAHCAPALHGTADARPAWCVDTHTYFQFASWSGTCL